MNIKITVLKILASIALLASLGLAIWGLLAPLGVWFDWWDFRKGFSILRNAHSFSLWVAISSGVIAVLLVVTAFKIRHQNLNRWASAVFASAILASLIYVVPESFRPPEGVNYPPIHDISTDIENPLEYVDVLPLRATAPNTVVYGGSPNMTPEKLAQLQTEAYPDLVPWQSELSQQVIFDKALNAVETLGWELVAAVPEEGRIEATDTTFWFRFKDDVVIKIESTSDGSLVNARSVSRVGGGDVGANAIRLRKLFALLEE